MVTEDGYRYECGSLRDLCSCQFQQPLFRTRHLQTGCTGAAATMISSGNPEAAESRPPCGSYMLRMGRRRETRAQAVKMLRMQFFTSSYSDAVRSVGFSAHFKLQLGV